jgi:endonuclease/exonuclease/phosphatase family metal-dependent hydrolase
MKIASYNVENLFRRAKALNEEESVAKRINTEIADLNSLLKKSLYTPEDKIKIVNLLISLGMQKSDTGEFAELRKNKGKLLSRKASTNEITIVANGCDDWIGDVVHKLEPIDEIAITNTGKVISDVNADIIGIVEAEDRITLDKFNKQVIKNVGGNVYKHVMLIDGNDERGIDVGIMTKAGYIINSIVSHIYDEDTNRKKIFSRDCPEYLITTPNNEKIYVLPNHFKSKFGGDTAASRNKRKEQSERTAAIYNKLLSQGNDNIIVMGDLNDTPDSIAIKPLFSLTNLQEVTNHPTFNSGTFSGKGTYGSGTDSNKIDYILLSPSLFNRVTAAGIYRKGAWTASNRWEMFPDLKKEIHAASDHHLIWCEIN